MIRATWIPILDYKHPLVSASVRCQMAWGHTVASSMDESCMTRAKLLTFNFSCIASYCVSQTVQGVDDEWMNVLLIYLYILSRLYARVESSL